MVTDTISDMLTRIRNANMVKHQIVQIPTTKLSKAIATIMKEEGFIENFEVYNQTSERVSKPGLRVYANSKTLPRVLDNLGIAIMSTSKGVMTNVKAKELGIGGEVLCYIW